MLHIHVGMFVSSRPLLTFLLMEIKLKKGVIRGKKKEENLTPTWKITRGKGGRWSFSVWKKEGNSPPTRIGIQMPRHIFSLSDVFDSTLVGQ